MSEPGPYVKIIADSVTEAGRRLTTVEMRFHRFVLAEFNTHGVLAPNSASSRAIPLAKQIKKIEEDLAFPAVWASEQKGMQGGDELSEEQQEQARAIWQSASERAVVRARALGAIGVHKSIANRLLEPFMWHTVVVTGTAWQNFFRQRCSPLAQPEIRIPAEMLKAAYDESKPTELLDGEWHLPYVGQDDWHAVRDNTIEESWKMLVKVSCARVARTSHLTQDGKRNLGEDLALYERLVSADPMHASPLEQVATPAPWNEHEVYVPNVIRGGGLAGKSKMVTLPMYGKLLGWHQHRYDVEVDRDYQSFS